MQVKFFNGTSLSSVHQVCLKNSGLHLWHCIVWNISGHSSYLMAINGLIGDEFEKLKPGPQFLLCNIFVWFFFP